MVKMKIVSKERIYKDKIVYIINTNEESASKFVFYYAGYKWVFKVSAYDWISREKMLCAESILRGLNS